MSSSGSTDLPSSEDAGGALEEQCLCLNEFHGHIQDRLSVHQNYQFNLIVLKYEEGKISYEKLRESIELLLANYPDVLTWFRDLELTNARSKSHQDDKHKTNVRISGNKFEDAKLSLAPEKRHSLFKMITYRSANIIQIKDLLLSQPGLASQRNERGQLPLHEACMKGYPYDIILALVEAYPDALAMTDNTGRLPLHYYLTIHSASSWTDSLVAATEDYSKKKLTEMSVDVVNLLGSSDLILQEDYFGYCPLKNFALECHFFDNNDKKSFLKATEVLNTMMDFDPPFSIFLFQKIRSFPHHFVIQAANNKFIKRKLNQAALNFLFLALTFLDLIIRILIIWMYASLPDRKNRSKGKGRGNNNVHFAILYIGIFYLFVRVVIRMYSFKEVGNMIDWTKNGWNWIQLAEYFLVLAATLRLHFNPLQDNGVLTTTAAGIQWLSLIIVLRPASQHFVEFWSGILNVMQTLLPFFVTTLVFIFGFVFMYYFEKKYSCDNEECGKGGILEIFKAIVLDAINAQISEEQSGDNLGSDFISVFLLLYGFVVILLLLNILVAIVIDSYSAARQKGEEMFWTERLIFVSEIEAVFSSCKKFRKSNIHYDFSFFLESKWHKTTLFLFQPKRFNLQLAKSRGYKRTKTTLSRACSGLKRFLSFVLVIPLWLVLGFITLGWLWPPQVKKFLLDGRIDEFQDENETKDSDFVMLETSIVNHIKKLEKRQNNKIENLQAEIETLRAHDNRLQSIDQALKNLYEALSTLNKDK